MILTTFHRLYIFFNVYLILKVLFFCSLIGDMRYDDPVSYELITTYVKRYYIASVNFKYLVFSVPDSQD